jgi:threonylcarbamoyladenosine tRNA methylthiotransferase MtaB
MVRALVEKPGLARAEDFTELAFEGGGAAGQLFQIAIDRHDGRRALGRRVDA